MPAQAVYKSVRLLNKSAPYLGYVGAASHWMHLQKHIGIKTDDPTAANLSDAWSRKECAHECIPAVAALTTAICKRYTEYLTAMLRLQTEVTGLD